MVTLEKVWNMFEVNNKDTRTTQLRRSNAFIVNSEQISRVSIANFEHALVCRNYWFVKFLRFPVKQSVNQKSMMIETVINC